MEELPAKTCALWVKVPHAVVVSLRPQNIAMTMSKKNKKNKRRGPRGENSALSERVPNSVSKLVRTPFPPRVRHKIVYTYAGLLTEAAAGAGATVSFSTNGLYDPYVPLGGGQPMYFDQLCTATGPYTKYRVYGVAIRVVFGSNTNASVMFGAYYSPSVTAPASLTEAQEKPMGQYTIVGQGSGAGKVVLHSSRKTHQVLGLSRTHISNDEYLAGAYNANPVLGSFFTVWLYGFGVVATGLITVDITYDAEFYAITNTGTS